MQKIESKRGRGRPRKSPEESTQSPVQTLERAIQLLKSVSNEDGLALTDLSQQLDIPAPTAYRLLSTLQSHGIVEFHEDTQQWMIGVETFRMGSAFLRRTRMIDMGRDLMRDLMHDSGETVNLAIEQDGDVVFVTQVETAEPIRAFFPPGTRGAIHASGIGKALLAELPRREVKAIIERKGLPKFTKETLTDSEALFNELSIIRERGWSIDNQERNHGMRCAAAAIYNEFGEAIAGVSVSGPTIRITEEKIDEFGPMVKTCAMKITQAIGGCLPDRVNKTRAPFTGWQ